MSEEEDSSPEASLDEKSFEILQDKIGQEDAMRTKRASSQIQPDWAIIAQGVLVSLSIARWRGEMQWTMEELSLHVTRSEAFTAAITEVIKPGKKLILPKAYASQINNIDTQGRRALKRHSFTLNGHFIPFTAYDDWKQENEALRRRYMAIAADLSEHYDTWVPALIGHYRTMANENYSDMERAQIPLEQTREEFVEWYANRIRLQIPTADFIAGSFHWETELSFIPMPSAIEAEMAQREQVRLNANLSREEAQQAHRINMELAEQTKARQEEQIDSMINELRTSVLESFYEVCAAISDELAESADGITLSASRFRSVKLLISQVSKMNMTDDKYMNDQVAKLEAMMELTRGRTAKPDERASGHEKADVLMAINEMKQGLLARARTIMVPQGRKLADGPPHGFVEEREVWGRKVKRLRSDLYQHTPAVKEVASDESIPPPQEPPPKKAVRKKAFSTERRIVR